MNTPDLSRGGWHATDIEAAFSRLDSAPTGLTLEEVEARRSRFGINTLPVRPTSGVLNILLSQFLSPLIYVLLAAAVVSLLLSEYTDAGFIFAVLLINAIIGTLQEFHAQRSAEALRRLVSARTIVLREGESFEVDAQELVPGDIVILENGSRVPADLRLCRSLDLEIDESLLTGESTPISKDAKATLTDDCVLADRVNMAYSGAIVNRGRGRGVVIATGRWTEVGRLATELESAEGAKPPLIQRMERFTMNIAVVLVIAVTVIAIVELMQGVAWYDVFIVSVALAVSAIPEGLPVAMTVALAISMNRMAKQNVIVRRLVAVEALGSCTVIASDKTGTLTMNQLTVRQIIVPGAAPWQVSGEGVTPEGSINTATGALDELEAARLNAVCRVAALCNEGFFGLRGGEWVGHGDSVDVALLVMAHKAGLVREELLSRFPEREVIPYESEFGYAATLHEDETEGHGLLLVKGALERLLPMCATMMTPQGEVMLSAAEIEAAMEALAADGYRTLAFAHARVPAGVEFGHESLTGLTLLGVVGMIDPLRIEAKSAVEQCHAAGIRACMITGDHPATAFSIGREVGLVSDSGQVVTGVQLKSAMAQSGADGLDALVADANVFARVEPSQKVAIVQSLQRTGEFVAVTGDGVNDAPALKTANVGVAMGQRGTDVAKESADLVITDDNFASIVSGVEEGRVAYRNIRKVIFLLISTGAAELVLFILSLSTGLPMPLTAIQLLWLNLVTNGIQHVALAFEPSEGDEMRRPPRRPAEPIFNRVMIERTLLSAALIGLLAFIVFRNLTAAGIPVETARNEVLLLMVLFENVHAFNSRSELRSAFLHNPLRNPLLLFGTIVAQLVHIGAMSTPGLNSVLGVMPVTFADWVGLVPIALLLLLVMEAHKYVRRRI